jgi:hypothetical protein
MLMNPRLDKLRGMQAQVDALRATVMDMLEDIGREADTMAE